MIIGGSIILMLSFFFSKLAKKTSVPSVLMLIVLGVILKCGLDAYGLANFNLTQGLELLGIIGLIMIVLEAALELKLKKEKAGIITRSLIASILGLALSVASAAAVIYFVFDGIGITRSLIYATPLSILSSAIIIPSVQNLVETKKEFHIYESTFSDILGIMLFYFIVGFAETGGTATISDSVGDFGISFLLTLIVSFVAGYGLIAVFQRINSGPRLFLLIAVLLLLYAIGKKLHLSPLIIILVFGLLVSNHKLFFKGFLKRLISGEFKEMEHGLHIVTLETAFVVRTFFFVVFGMSISLASLWDVTVILTATGLLATIYGGRWVMLRIVEGSDVSPQIWIAPRGLITVLLFYAIPSQFLFADFDSGILLGVILGTSVIMTIGMIRNERLMAESIQEAEVEITEEAEKTPDQHEADQGSEDTSEDSHEFKDQP